MKWRKNWADMCNKKFAEKGLDIRIDHRTLEAQGIDREPQIHVGVTSKAMERKGIINERVQKNRDIIARNQAKLRQQPTDIEQRNDYAKNLFDDEVEHIGKFSRQQLQQNRKIDGSIKWYKGKVQEVEKEITDLLFEREKTSIVDFKRRKDIKEQVEKLGEKKAGLETAFYKKYNVELENADILRTDREELQVSRNYLEVRKIKRDLGKLKFEYKQNQSLQGKTDLQALERQMDFIEKQADDIAKIEQNISDLQSKQTNVSSKKELAIEWETLQREKLTQKMVDEIRADIKKIKYSSSIQKNKVQAEIFKELRAITAQNQAQKIHTLKENYIMRDREINTLEQEISHAEREARNFNDTAEKIDELITEMRDKKQRIDGLKAERQKLGIFKGKEKKSIDNQINHLENSYGKVVGYLEREYKISPEQSDFKIQEFERMAQSKRDSQAKLQDKIKSLSESRDILGFEYKQHKLLADISPDKQKIHDRLKELDKQSRTETPRENISRIRSEQKLDIVTKQDFEKILQGIQPEQAEMLIKQREHEREFKRVRDFARYR